MVKSKLKNTLRARKPFAVLRGRFVMVVLVAFGVALFSMSGGPASAASDASFSLSPSSGSYKVGSSFSVSVYETSASGDNVNAVQANLSYPSSLQYTGSSLGKFTLATQNSGGGGSINIGAASTSTVSGKQLVVKINFKVLAKGTASVGMVSGSGATPTVITNNSGTSVWNGALPHAAFSLAAATTTTKPPPSGSSTSSNTSTSPASTSTSTGKSTSSASTSTTEKAPAKATQPSKTETPTKTAAKPPEASVSITITDSAGKPIANAKVSVDGHYSGYTNSQGKIGFSNIASGTHTIVVTASGKKSLQQQVSLMPNQTKLVALKLSQATSLSGIVIAGVVVILLIVGYGGFRFFRGHSSGFKGNDTLLPPTAVVG